MVKGYRKKPVVIKAVKWNGENLEEVMEFCHNYARLFDIQNKIELWNLEGIMFAEVGDFIIQDVKGEFYPYKPDIFEKTYELIN